VEYIAPSDYCVRAPMSPSYLFLIDVSYVAVQTGILSLVCQKLDEFVAGLIIFSIKNPNSFGVGYNGNSCTKIAIMTYDSSVHFYRINVLHFS